MLNPVKVGKRIRYSYARIKEVMEMPHLLDIQRNSYAWFKEEGLQEIFKDISPIADFSGNLELFFGESTFGECKYSLEECKHRDGTYAAPVRVKVKLRNKQKGDVKEQDVFLGDFPIMTDTGTFIINGAERVIVSQLVRSPGAYYDKEIDLAGKNIYKATVIPNRGAWIELETDSSAGIAVRIDRTRKMPMSYFLRALDFESNEQILNLFDVKFFILSKLHEYSADNFPPAGNDSRDPITIDYLNQQPHSEESFDQLLLAYSELDAKNDFLSNYKYLLDKFAELDDKNTLTAGYKALVDMLDADRKNAEDNKEKALIGIYNRLRPGEPPSAENAESLLQSLFFDPRRYDLASVGRYKITKKLGWKRRLLGHVLAEDLFDLETGELLIPADTVVTQETLDAIPDEREIPIFIGWKQMLLGESLTEDIRDPNTKQMIIPAGGAITEELLDSIDNEEIFKLAASKLHRGLRYPIPLKIKTDKGAFTMLCAPTLSIKDNRTICIADIIASINYVFNLMSETGIADDIDHLGNRRVRAVGELLQNQFRIGMARMERVVRERMTTQDAEIVTPQNLINIRPVVAAIKEFFGSSQLSQFMDQHNPLSELTHKRRLSALGPGGLSRERAGFEVRDVHNSHYGRMCPIETPEGPNIGLIGSLSNYARVNQFGFMETPYRRVDKTKHQVTNDVRYMTADEEEAFTIAQANEPLNDNDWFVNERVTARRKEETTKVRREDVDFMDVSPKQVVSIATALIPFLENDDANRALMGANMQRQAVPLLKTQAPLVGTGMEYKAACDSGVMILAKRSGLIKYVDANSIEILAFSKDFVEFSKSLPPDTPFKDKLAAFSKDNDPLNAFSKELSPLLENDLLPFGKELSAFITDDFSPFVLPFGKMLSAFSNDLSHFSKKFVDFGKDVVALKNKIIKYLKESGSQLELTIFAFIDKLDSYAKNAFNLKTLCIEHLKNILGKENVRDDDTVCKLIDKLIDKLKNLLDKENVSDDTVDKLIVAARAKQLFNKLADFCKLSDSLIAKTKSLIAKIKDSFQLQKFVRSNQGTCINQIPIVSECEEVYRGQPIADGPATSQGELALGYNILVAYMPWEGYNYEDAILLSENLIKRDIYTSIHIEEYTCDARDTKLGPEEITRDIPNISEEALTHLDSEGIIAIGADVRTGDILVGKVTPKGETELTAEERLLRAIFGEKAREVRDTSLKVPHGESGKIVAVNVFTREQNDEMAPGVNKQVRVYIAQKRKISVGDKMSGRHGNKGVVSKIMRQEDMPFLPDGTPVDIVLNPLGVPSRMNIGQILETHLGMAVRKLFSGKPNVAGIATPVFDGAHEIDINSTIAEAKLDADGKTILFDGRTGLPFLNRVTVGCVYMLKLHHLVDDKIHARSTGPYSLVTQQPLGGKAQFGGQRFGEMEVWALEAYGASYTLQEILTVKSDDVLGRVKAYEAIVKGNNIPEPGVPESFKVLIKELQSIALDIQVLNHDGLEIAFHDDDDDDTFSVKAKAKDLDIDLPDPKEVL